VFNISRCGLRDGPDETHRATGSPTRKPGQLDRQSAKINAVSSFLLGSFAFRRRYLRRGSRAGPVPENRQRKRIYIGPARIHLRQSRQKCQSESRNSLISAFQRGNQDAGESSVSIFLSCGNESRRLAPSVGSASTHQPSNVTTNTIIYKITASLA